MTVTITRGRTTVSGSSFKDAKKKLDEERAKKKSVDKSEIKDVQAGSKSYSGGVEKVQGKEVYVGVRGVSKKEQAEKAQAKAEKEARQKARERLRPAGMSEKEFRERTGTPTQKERAEQAAEQIVLRKTLSPYSAAVPRSQKIFIKETSTRKDENSSAGKLDRDSSGRNSVGSLDKKQKLRQKQAEDYARTLIKREQRLNILKTAVYERTGLKSTPEQERISTFRFLGGTYPTKQTSIGVYKAMARLPIETATLPIWAAGRARLAYESLTYPEGRKESFKALKKTPQALARSYDPRTTEGLVNIGATLFAVKEVAGKSYSGKTELQLEPYKKAYGGKKTTYVGEGLFRGQRAKAVVVEKGGVSKSYIRVGKRLFKTEGKAGGVKISKVKTSAVRELQPVYKGEGFERSRYLGDEVLKTEVKGKSVQGRTVAEVDLKQTELVKSRVDASPEVIVKKTLKGTKEVTVREPTVEFGKEKFPLDQLEFDIVPEPSARAKFAQKTALKGGRLESVSGRLVLKEKPVRQYVFEESAKKVYEKAEPLLRSKKGQLLLERQKFDQFKVKRLVEPATATKVGIPQTTLSGIKTSTRLMILPRLRTKTDSKIRTEAKLSTKTRFEPVVKVDFKQITKAQQKPEVRIDYKPLTRLSQSTRLKTETRTKTELKTTPTQSGFGPGFSFSAPSVSTPLPVPPLLPPLPGLQMDSRKKKGKGTKGKAKRKYRPSIVGIELGLKQTGKKTALTGYGVRGL